MACVTFLKKQHYSESGKRSQLQYLYDHNKNKPDWIFDVLQTEIKLSTVLLLYNTDYTQVSKFEFFFFVTTVFLHQERQSKLLQILNLYLITKTNK